MHCAQRRTSAPETVWAPSACSCTCGHQREERNAERAQVGQVVGRATGAWRAGRGPGGAHRAPGRLCEVRAWLAEPSARGSGVNADTGVGAERWTERRRSWARGANRRQRRCRFQARIVRGCGGMSCNDGCRNVATGEEPNEQNAPGRGIVDLIGLGSGQPSTSEMRAMIFAESMPPVASSRVSTRVPFSPPPSSCGRMSCPRYHARLSSQRAL